MEHWLLRAAAMRPERVAVATPDATLTYAELETRARGAAGALGERGVVSGDRVALVLPAGPGLVAALHGCFLLGAVAVPIDLRLSADERGARTRGADAIVEDELRGPQAPDVTRLALESVAAIVHTSGTTAAPRPVSLTYGNWLASALGSAVALGLDPDERWLCPMPLVHVGGLSIPIRSAIYGTTAMLHERFDTDAVADALSDLDQRITVVSLVPTMLARLLDAGLHDPPTLRSALLGGGPIAPALLEQARRAGVPVAPTYGMTEACSQIATHGWPLPGVEVRAAEDGELLVRGPTVAPGSLAPDGWLRTGDLGAIDARGRLTITGRKADTIITGGENVAPAEVEAVLLEHPAIADAAVHARLDPEWGEAVVATVVLRDGLVLNVEELRAFCAARLAGFKVPKAVELVERLPRTESGKLLRRELG
jgi:O-succinylbenzoic acid--CoA ligase